VDSGSRVYAYVDETGDRGASPASSPIFGMSAVILDDVGVREMRDCPLLEGIERSGLDQGNAKFTSCHYSWP